MSAAREKDEADFDLEAFIELFDEALTSDDPSVQKTLQHLMVICALARNHSGHSARSGPLRRLYDDQANILRRLERLEVNNAGWRNGGYNPSAPYGPGISPLAPYTTPNTPIPGTPAVPGTWPGTGTGIGPGPNQIWCGTSTSATSISLASDSATAKSSTSYAYDPMGAGATIAERVGDLLKSDYRGSGLSTIKAKDEL